MADEVSFTLEKYKALQVAYDRAVLARVHVFKFEGRDYLVDYAKYLLEYLKGRFEGGGNG